MKRFVALGLMSICVLSLASCKKTLQPPSETTIYIKNKTDSVQGDEASTDEVFDVAVSWANSSDIGKIIFGGLNRDTMAISSVQHLPIYKFDTLKELEQFKRDFSEVVSMDESYDEIPSFNETIAAYDKTFFKENTLMLVYVSANSGSFRFDINNIFCDGSYFCIHVEQTNNPEEVTDDEAGWFITAAITDDIIANCTEFDADLNNFKD